MKGFIIILRIWPNISAFSRPWSMQKDHSPIIFCLLSCITGASIVVHFVFVLIRFVFLVVKFYNHMLLPRYGCILILCSPPYGASRMKAAIKINADQQIVALYKPLSLWIRQPGTCESLLPYASNVSVH